MGALPGGRGGSEDRPVRSLPGPGTRGILRRGRRRPSVVGCADPVPV